MTDPSTTFLGRALSAVAPQWQLRRMKARLQLELAVRHYEAASVGRRTQGWKRFVGDANVANQMGLSRLRDHARDLVRNNRLMTAAVRTIGNHTVGWGLSAKAVPTNPAVMATWKAWAESTDCDADGRDDLYGLQKLIIRGVAEGGEMLVRRRFRRLEDGLPIPLQLQVLEPDYLDTYKSLMLPGGARIIQGVEFDAIGNRVAYWLYPEHPGASFRTMGSIFPASRRIPASEILHIFQRDRAGQVRAVSWFAPIILPTKDLDEYVDAQLMKQKIAACLAVITSDPDGSNPGLGTTDDTKTPATDTLSPGAMIDLPPGRTVSVVNPPTVGDYDVFVRSEDRRTAKALGLSYEDFVGDYSQVNFSSARMSRLEHYENVYDWRWRLMVPQFCTPVWNWTMEALQLAGELPGQVPAVRWSAPPIAMIEPDKEGLAYMRNRRAGLQSLFDQIRERGYDPEELLAEMAEENTLLDKLGLRLDSDPRYLTQAGQVQSANRPADATTPSA